MSTCLDANVCSPCVLLEGVAITKILRERGIDF
jgi:hypothetical protein